MSTLLLYSRLCLGLPNDSFPSVSLAKTYIHLSSPSYVSHDRSKPLFLLWTPELYLVRSTNRRSQWPRRLRRKSAAPRLLRLWVYIPQGEWTFACCECCVLSGRGLCEELITRPGESYRLWFVVACDLDTSWMRRPWITGGCRAKN